MNTNEMTQAETDEFIEKHYFIMNSLGKKHKVQELLEETFEKSGIECCFDYAIKSEVRTAIITEKLRPGRTWKPYRGVIATRVFRQLCEALGLNADDYITAELVEHAEKTKAIESRVMQGVSVVITATLDRVPHVFVFARGENESIQQMPGTRVRSGRPEVGVFPAPGFVVKSAKQMFETVKVRH